MNLSLENIPRAVVLRYRRVLTGSVDLEDLESLANVALAEAVRRFDPRKAPQGEAGLRPFCYQAVWLTLRSYLWPKKGGRFYRGRTRCRARLESLVRGTDGDFGPTRLVDLLGYPDGAPAALADREEFARLLRVLPRSYRAVVEEHVVEGLTLEEVARRRGVTKQAVGHLWRKAVDRLVLAHYPNGDPRRMR